MHLSTVHNSHYYSEPATETLVRREWLGADGMPSKWPLILGVTGGLFLLFTILGIWACCRTRVSTTVKARPVHRPGRVEQHPQQHRCHDHWYGA